MQISERWLSGEPSLDDMLKDPIVRLLMKHDGLSEDTVRAVFQDAAKRLRARSNRIGRAA
ncbi:MAG: hypothetical protein R3285_01625 [Kiloniellales bacterium]|nr:hypothetical protein [Kiloniellales bacterium]